MRCLRFIHSSVVSILSSQQYPVLSKMVFSLFVLATFNILSFFVHDDDLLSKFDKRTYCLYECIWLCMSFRLQDFVCNYNNFATIPSTHKYPYSSFMVHMPDTYTQTQSFPYSSGYLSAIWCVSRPGVSFTLVGYWGTVSAMQQDLVSMAMTRKGLPGGTLSQWGDIVTLSFPWHQWVLLEGGTFLQLFGWRGKTS